MKKLVLALGIVIIIGLFYFWKDSKKGIISKPSEKEELGMLIEKSMELPAVKLIVIYDNYLYDENLKTGWGFSCLVEISGKSVLFDTGADSPTLLSNMEKLGIDPKEINTIVLSHIHDDHVGGLSGFLEKHNRVTAYSPSSFPISFKEKIKSTGANFVDVSESIKIIDGIYSTGELGTWLKEQSLIVETKKGLIIITGCAHPGIVEIIKKTKELFNENIYLVLGGFHLGGTSDSQLRGIIKDFRGLGVQKAAPCHCSGDRCRELFQEEYGSDFIEVGVGKIIEINEEPRRNQK